MINSIKSIVEKMASSNGMKKDKFIESCKQCSLILDEDEYDVALEYINDSGIKVVIENDTLFTQSRFKNYKDEVFCVVDIETNGNTPQNSQIIEIGAIKYQYGKIIDRFESFVYCDFIPEYIERITHISKCNLKNAPKLKVVLPEFREFLSDSIFVAHNVNFDYNFISGSLKKIGMEELLNRKLCTINLAKKTIESEKYGLSYLKEELGIDIANHHRAYADALSALEILKISFENLPEDINTTEELISFSNPQKKKKRKKQE